jgi:hypothetical protein
LNHINHNHGSGASDDLGGHVLYNQNPIDMELRAIINDVHSNVYRRHIGFNGQGIGLSKNGI